MNPKADNRTLDELISEIEGMFPNNNINSAATGNRIQLQLREKLKDLIKAGAECAITAENIEYQQCADGFPRIRYHIEIIVTNAYGT